MATKDDDDDYDEESSSVLMCDPDDVVFAVEPITAASSTTVADALQLAELARAETSAPAASSDDRYRRSVTLLQGGEEVLKQLEVSFFFSIFSFVFV